MHIHPPHRWEVMLRSDTMDKGSFLRQEFSKTQKCSPNCSNIRECKVHQRRCEMEIKKGIMSFAEKNHTMANPCSDSVGIWLPPGRKMVQFSQIRRQELISKESSGQGTVPPTAQESSCRGSLHYNLQDLSMVSHQLAFRVGSFLSHSGKTASLDLQCCSSISVGTWRNPSISSWTPAFA